MEERGSSTQGRVGHLVAHLKTLCCGASGFCRALPLGYALTHEIELTCDQLSQDLIILIHGPNVCARKIEQNIPWSYFTQSQLPDLVYVPL